MNLSYFEIKLKKKLTIIISTYDQGIFNMEKAIQLEIPEVLYLVIFQNPNNLSIPNFLKRKDIVVMDTKTKGLSVSRNLGIAHCTTTYALLADDDVAYIEEGLHELLKIIDQSPQLDYGVFKIKTLPGEPEYNNYPKQITKVTEIQHYISSIEVLLNVETLKKNKLKFDERFGLGTLLMKGEEEILIKDLIAQQSIGYYFPIYIVIHPYLSTGKKKLKEWKNYFTKGAYHYRINKTDYKLPNECTKIRFLKNKFFYFLGQLYIKFTT